MADDESIDVNALDLVAIRHENNKLRSTIFVTSFSFIAWLIVSYMDHKLTPRLSAEVFVLPKVVQTSYQMCFVAYLSTWIATCLKLVFESNPTKLRLNVLVLYICTIAAGSYFLVWIEYSPILLGEGACLFVPQRYIFYAATIPAMMNLLGQISNYSQRLQALLIVLHYVMLAAGLAGTLPSLSRPLRFLCYSVAIAPFPVILFHKWRMITQGMDNTDKPAAKQALNFIRVYGLVMYQVFPIVYFGAIEGQWPIELVEPTLAIADWFCKFIYTSSLLEFNFFAIVQQRERLRREQEVTKIDTILDLNASIARKDDFLSTVSHELRTPLNGIIGLSEALLVGSGGSLPERALATINTVKMSGKRLLQLINDVLDAAKMRQGGMVVIKHVTVDLTKLVDDVLDITRPLVNSRKVQLLNNVKDLPCIIGDGDRITQILYNLLGNACKFTRSGSITVNGGYCDDLEHVFISVSDTGTGIASDKFAQIFGAFEQVDMSTTRRYGGTGLGLHLVKQLVLAHHGDITVESEVGVGSTFTVILPIDLTKEAQAPIERAASGLPFPTPLHTAAALADQSSFGVAEKRLSPDFDTEGHRSGPAFLDSLLMSSNKGFHHDNQGSSYLILSIDDDPVNQMVVENLLRPDGSFKVQQAMGGIEALEFLASHPHLPDLILLDVLMSDMSGYEVCEEIRRRYNEMIPIIMISIMDSPDDIARGLEVGADDYVKKPFHRVELLGRIKAQLRSHQMTKAALISARSLSNEGNARSESPRGPSQYDSSKAISTFVGNI